MIRIKRVFIGIKIDKSLYPKIDAWRENVSGFSGLRWIDNKNLHITLVPPWYEFDLERILKIMDGINFKNPILMIFYNVGMGPSKKNPRLIWAEGKDNKILEKLKVLLDKSLGMTEKRPFKLHLTLARFKKAEIKNLSKLKVAGKIDWKQEVNSICLYESKLKRSGAEYKILHERKF